MHARKRKTMGIIALLFGLVGCGTASPPPSKPGPQGQATAGFELRYAAMPAAAMSAEEQRGAIEESIRIVRQRASKLNLSHALISSEGQEIIVKLEGENELSVADLRVLLPIGGDLDLRLVRHEGGFMPELCASLAADSKAGVMRIEVATDAWQDATGAHVKQCYLSANDRVAMLNAQEAEAEGCRFLGNAARSRCVVTGRSILMRYLEGRDDVKPEPGYELAFESSESSAVDGERGERYWRSYYLQSESILSASSITSVAVEDSPDFEEPLLRITFDERTASELAALSSDNIGRKLGILLDGEVLAAPIIQSAITGGAITLPLGPTSQRADILAIALESGTLPLKLTEVSAKDY